MSQIFNFPIPSSEILSTSRTTINDAVDALRTHFIGGSDPGTLVDGMLWVNSGTNLIKARKSGATITLGTFAAEMGHLPTAGGTMTGVINMGSNKITNITQGATATNEAATVLQVEGRLYRGGDTLSPADAYLAYTNPVNESLWTDYTLTHRFYCDKKVYKVGDTGISGRLAYSVSPAYTTGPPSPGGEVQNILRRDEIENLLSFNPTVGHRHDGNNSRKVQGTSIGAASEPLYRQLVSLGTGGEGSTAWETTHGPHVLNDTPGTTLVTISTNSGGFVDIDYSGICPADVRAGKQIAILAIIANDLDSGGQAYTDLTFRSAGAAGIGVTNLYSYIDLIRSDIVFVPLSVSRHFEYKSTNFGNPGQMQIQIKSMGYLTNP